MQHKREAVHQLLVNAFDPQNELTLRWAAIRPFLAVLCAALQILRHPALAAGGDLLHPGHPILSDCQVAWGALHFMARHPHGLRRLMAEDRRIPPESLTVELPDGTRGPIPVLLLAQVPPSPSPSPPLPPG